MALSRITPITPVRLNKFDREQESEKRHANKREKVSAKPEQSFSVILSSTLKEKEK